MKKILILTLVVGLTALFLGGVALAADEAAGPLVKGASLPDNMMVGSMDGGLVKIKETLGPDYTVFTFMTTACSACQAEIKSLMILRETTGNKLKVVAISVDMMGADAVNAYEKRNRYGIDYILDTEFNLPPRFGFNFTPSMFLTDAKGTILLMKGGFSRSDWKETADAIKALVK